MIALSVPQPWALLLIYGVKHFEIRSWKTKHRGRLLLHAGQALSRAARKLCATRSVQETLAGFTSAACLPRGVLLGTINLDACMPTDQLLYDNFDPGQRAFSDFRPGHWAWKMSDPRRFVTPIPVRGQRAIFEVPDDLLPFDSSPYHPC